MQDIQTLLEMLTYKRPHGSDTEAHFVSKFIEPLSKHPNVLSYYCDEVGNVFVRTSFESKSMFTAHVDTVHSKQGFQVVTHDQNIGLVYLDDKAALGTNCLGADDTAGMWLMIQMIDNGVPGTYVFFRGEECGGIGSRHAAKMDPGFFKMFDKAVAFDRRGSGDVITHQSCGRCCSNVFAEDLANHLNLSNLTYAPSDHGIYTDTANLIDLIGECTNLSVGYDGEHTVNESLDLYHLTALRDALLLVDWDGLTISRKPGEVDPDDYNYGFKPYSGYSSSKYPSMAETDKVMAMRYQDMVQWVKDNDPEDVAEVMYDLVDQLLMAQDMSFSPAHTDFDMAEGWQ